MGLCLLKGSPSISTKKNNNNNSDEVISPIFLVFSLKHEDASHLEQSGLVGVVFLVVSPLCVHLVPLTGPGQLLEAVEQRRVQGVGVDPAHQVLPVVLPAWTHTHLEAFPGGRGLPTDRPGLLDSLAEPGLSWLSLEATGRIDLLTSLVFLLHHTTGV